ncbi:MAG: F0F1 ATP synthase subunit delta [Candidatus Dormibacteria bacterium]
MSTGGGPVRRYAQAAFEVAREQNDLPGWQRELAQLQYILENEGVASAFASPQLDDGRRIAMAISFTSEGFKPEVVNFFKLLVLSRRTGAIADIVKHFESLVDEAAGRVELRVTSARPLDAAAQAELREQIQGRLGKEAKIDFELDPKILGGLIIRQGDRVTDGSVKRRLEELREQLTT